jgi:sulfite reductase (ferredoxin)
MTQTPLSANETIKRESDYLRGAIASELADANAFVSDASYELLKFHGSYQGYDRDSATTRKKQGLDKLWEFMLRLKIPGGRLSAAQYLALDGLCDVHANGTLRITTRQTFQFHCIAKANLKPFIADINRQLLSTLGGCGDVVRNVTTCPAPIHDSIHATLEEACFTLAKELAPKTESYWDIWLDGEKIENYPFLPTPAQGEPLYGETYMPRKFKIAIGQPEDNCMDMLCNDLAFQALFNGQELHGYNIAIGGGLGMNHTNPKTYPYLAKPVAFITPQHLLKAAESVVKLQRDHGDRSNRKHARLKYVVAEQGLDWCKTKLEGYFGTPLDAPLPTATWHVEDHLGWHAQGDGKWFLGVYIPSGRIGDGLGGVDYRSALREVIASYRMPLRLTLDQNIILCDIEESEKPAIAQMLKRYGIVLREELTSLERNMIACVSYPTCGLALAEAERAQPSLAAMLAHCMEEAGVAGDTISVRIAGCPNGCSRPYVGDIGIVGRTPETYAIYIGGDFEGTRLNTKIFDKVPFKDIPALFAPLFRAYKANRNAGEGFGDFCTRHGIEATKKIASDALASTYSWAA